MSDRHKVVVTVPHSESCWIAADDHKYPYDRTGRVEYRDAIGRKGNGDNCAWEVWRCEDPRCPSELLVRHLWLVETVGRELGE